MVLYWGLGSHQGTSSAQRIDPTQLHLARLTTGFWVQCPASSDSALTVESAWALAWLGISGNPISPPRCSRREMKRQTVLPIGTRAPGVDVSQPPSPVSEVFPHSIVSRLAIKHLISSPSLCDLLPFLEIPSLGLPFFDFGERLLFCTIAHFFVLWNSAAHSTTHFTHSKILTRSELYAPLFSTTFLDLCSVSPRTTIILSTFGICS